MRAGKPLGSRPHGRTLLVQISAYGVPHEGLRRLAGGVGEVVEGLLEGGVEVGLRMLGLGSGGRLVHEARVRAAITGGRRNIAGTLLYGSPRLAVLPHPGGRPRPWTADSVQPCFKGTEQHHAMPGDAR